MDDILYLVHSAKNYNDSWTELKTSSLDEFNYQFSGVYFSLITKDNLKKEGLFGNNNILIFSKKLLEQENYHINIHDYNGLINEENTYFPWNLDKAVKKIRKIAKNKEFYIGNEVIFHDNIPMKYLCMVIKKISLDYNIDTKYNISSSAVFLPHYEIYNSEEPDKTKIPFYCHPMEDNFGGRGKNKLSSNKFYKNMAILCNINPQLSRTEIIEEIKKKMMDLYYNREKQKLKEFKLLTKL